MHTGINTFSSKFPWDAAKPTATSLAITWTATMVTDSHWVGFTLPGMMELPGSFSGIKISPRPQRGPLASQRMSLAIFIISAARPFKAPWAKTSSSLLVREWNLLGAVLKSFPVSSDTAFATSASKPLGALRPVPTAVPPSASSWRPGRLKDSMVFAFSSIFFQPLISWEKVMGVASCRWVRPVLMIPSFSSIRRPKVPSSREMDGKSLSSISTAAAMCMAVGKVSLELWDIFTWSLGCRSFSPASSLPRLAMTSFTFILD